MTGKHTPGPWAWFGDNGGGVYLATPDRGRRVVMGFKRYGMNGAQPTFCVGSIMKPAAELVEFAVGDKGVRGFEAAKTDASVYRYDVSGIDHPDARLIAAAPDLLEALTGIVDRMGATESDDGHKDIWRAAFDAIRRATGAA